MPRNVLITGGAGFIGFHVAQYFLSKGHFVTIADNFNGYYSPELKRRRISALSRYSELLSVECMDIADAESVRGVFSASAPDVVVHLAAQAGVRYSIDHPEAYVSSNLIGFVNILEACRSADIRHLVYASSSSVYGSRNDAPFSEDQVTDFPISLYAATKKSNEVIAYAYSHLYKFPTTGLRLFTVYGPYGRPDMAYFKFAEKLLKNQPIEVYNGGKLSRDFTYIDDVVEGVARIVDHPPDGSVPHKIVNVGGNKPVALDHFIYELERALSNAWDKSLQFQHKILPMQAGDVPLTCADTGSLDELIGYVPHTSLKEGLSKFAEWFVRYKS